jgi:hypothetical protein
VTIASFEAVSGKERIDDGFLGRFYNSSEK